MAKGAYSSIKQIVFSLTCRRGREDTDAARERSLDRQLKRSLRKLMHSNQIWQRAKLATTALLESQIIEISEDSSYLQQVGKHWQFVIKHPFEGSSMWSRA